MRPGWYWATYVDKRNVREIVYVQLSHCGKECYVFRAGTEFEYRTDEFIFHRRIED